MRAPPLSVRFVGLVRGSPQALIPTWFSVKYPFISTALSKSRNVFLCVKSSPAFGLSALMAGQGHADSRLCFSIAIPRWTTS